MLKKLKQYKWLLLIPIGLTVLLVTSFIYKLISSTVLIPKIDKPQQTQMVHSNTHSAKSPNVTFANDSDIDNDVIKVKDYEQFWVWTPPKDDTKLSQAHTLYILQGEISSHKVPYYRSDNDDSAAQSSLATLIPQGLGVRSLSDKKIWLVYRATSQEWSPEVMAQLIERLEKWQRAGNQVMGIQIDYDSPTYQLDKYAELLKGVRQQLPARYQISVTGLLDWSNQANDPQFAKLSHVIDELVVQTYQGTTTLLNYSQYLKKLENLEFDFKVGIIEGSQWQGAAFLENNPNFKGYVVFLR